MKGRFLNFVRLRKKILRVVKRCTIKMDVHFSLTPKKSAALGLLANLKFKPIKIITTKLLPIMHVGGFETTMVAF